MNYEAICELEKFRKKIKTPKKVLVFSGSKKEFDVFIENKVREFNLYGFFWDGYEYTYLLDSNSVRGKLYDELIMCGTYFLRKDVDLDVIYSSIVGVGTFIVDLKDIRSYNCFS